MTDRSWERFWNAVAWAIAGLGTVLLAYRLPRLISHVAEDAYITYRFATHLAAGEGLTWNVGTDPVEGYTSPFHVGVLAVFVKLGLPVRGASQALNMATILGLITVFWVAIRHSVGRWAPAAAFLLACYLVEARLAVHVVAGLDTTLFMLAVLTASVVGFAFLRTPTRSWGIALALTDLCCLLIRPDAAPFLLGQGLVLGWIAWTAGPDERRTRLTETGVVYGVLVGLGLAYLGWKLYYFGYLLPNPFYLKSNQVALEGLDRVIGFLKTLWVPGVAALVLALLGDREKVREWWSARTARWETALLVVPTCLFLLYYTTVIHEVGYADRFEYPMYLLIVMAVARPVAAGRPFSRLTALLGRWVDVRLAIPVVAALTLGGLYAVFEATYRDFPWFRIVEDEFYRPIGEALASTGLGPNATVIFPAAGVVPYVSRFSHIDPVGLVDNVLSGRQDMTVEEREAYIFSHDADVYIGPEPPAAPGVTDPASDPVLQSVYGREVLLAEGRFKDNFAWRRFYGHLSPSEQADLTHARMRELRDNWIWLGEIRYPVPEPPRFTHFAYVSRNSPHRAALTDALTRILDTPAEEFDLNGPS